MKTYILAVSLAVGLLATSSVANESNGCTLDFNNPPSLLAFQSCKAAAEQGSADAQYNLGHFYSFGHGVEQNIEQAVRWLTIAAEQDFESDLPPANALTEQDFGIIKALVELGEMYEFGWLVKQDIDEAVRLHTKGAMHGSWVSIDALSRLASAQNRLEPNSEFEEREAQLQANLDAANTSNAELRRRIEVDYTENSKVSELKSEFEEGEARLQASLDAANTSNAELRKRIEVDYTENSKVFELMNDLNGRIIELDLQLDAVNTTNVELRKRIENDYVAQDDYQIRVAQVEALNNQIVELREEIDKERRRRAETNALFMNFREECSTQYACADAMDIEYVSNE